MNDKIVMHEFSNFAPALLFKMMMTDHFSIRVHVINNITTMNVNQVNCQADLGGLDKRGMTEF